MELTLLYAVHYAVLFVNLSFFCCFNLQRTVHHKIINTYFFLWLVKKAN